MIILQQNTNNQFPATVSMNVTISNPVYLFEFQHKLSNEFWYIIPYKVPTAYTKPSYDLFNMAVDFNTPESFTNNTATSGNLHLIPGEYLVRVFQQTSTSNLDPLLSQGEIYQILAKVDGTDIICTPEPPYEGGFDDEWIVYDECQPTPIVSVSATARETPTSTPTPTVTPTNTQTQTQTPTQTGTATNTPTQTPTETPVPSVTPTNTSTPTNTPTNTETPTNTPTNTTTQTNTPSPTPTIPPLDCSWSGTTSLWENNTNQWQECSRLPEPTLTPTPSITASLSPTPSITASLSATPTPTETPVPPLMFLVSSGVTQEDACGTGPYFYIYAENLGNCQSCYDLGLTCWSCLVTTQQLFVDYNLTIPVTNGYYSNNQNTTGGENYATIYVVNGFPQPGGFQGCPFGPTPTPTATVTQTPTNTVTPTPSSTDLPGCITVSFEACSSACTTVTLCGGNTASRCYSTGQGQSYCVRVVNNVPQYTITSGCIIVTLGGAC